MKKVLSILCVILMLCSLAACGGNNADMESYLQENKEELMAQVPASEMFGAGATADVTVEGNKFAFVITAPILDTLDDEQIDGLKTALEEEFSDPTEEELEEMRSEDERLKNCDGYAITIKNSKGDVIASVG